MTNILDTAAKACLAGALAGLSALGGYLTNSTELSQITAGQWVFVAIAALTSFGAVWGVSNKPGTTSTSKP